MNDFNVIITPDAEADLYELDDYISFQLMAPDTAISYIRDIQLKISDLQRAPKRFRLIDEEPWHSRGIRRMNAKGFAIFFSINEEHSEVFIQNIIYQKRDLPRVLSSLYPDVGEL